VSRSARSAAVPVILLTGYLGAGKTSLLNHLLRDPDSRVGVVVNDFGSLNVDAALVAGQVDEPIPISGGCVCCLSDTSALEDALASLAQPQLELDAIIVEASGIAEPLILARMVSQWGRHRFHLAGVIDVVDALMHGETVDTASAPPVRYAATTLVVVNKLDAIPADQRDAVVEAIRARVHERNPRAHVTGTVFGRLDPQLVLDPGSGKRSGPDDPSSLPTSSPSGEQAELPIWDLLREEYAQRDAALLASTDVSHVPHRHAQSVTVQVDGCVDAARVLDLVEDLPAGVYRVKGAIAVRDGRQVRRYLVQAVGPSVYVARLGRATAEAAGGSVTSALVAIGETLAPAEVEQRLRTVLVVDDGGEHTSARGGTREKSGLERLEGYVRLHS
jgi:G3E family GTPase